MVLATSISEDMAKKVAEMIVLQHSLTLALKFEIRACGFEES